MLGVHHPHRPTSAFLGLGAFADVAALGVPTAGGRSLAPRYTPDMDEPTLDAPPEPQEALPGIGVCPYLVSSAGPWRSAEAARDHRCSMAPRGTRLELDHQRRYCLGTGGPGCPRYVPARAPGRLVSTLPVVVDRGPLGAALEPDGLRRFAAPASVVIVGAALGAFLLARGPGAPGPGPGASGSAAGPTMRPSTSPAT